MLRLPDCILRKTTALVRVSPLVDDLGRCESRNRRPAPLTQNELIEQRVLPQLEHLFQKLVAEKRDTTIDGQRRSAAAIGFCPARSRSA